MEKLNQAYSISIFLPDGTPAGVQIASRSHWTGVVLSCPRHLYVQNQHRSEFAGSGVYVLMGPSEKHGTSTETYVGRASCLRKRLKKHFEKDFWDSVVVVTKTDQSLNAADIEFLEQHLISAAAASANNFSHNIQEPDPPKLIESHLADLRTFLRDVLAIFRVLGMTAFDTEVKAVIDKVLQPHQDELALLPQAGLAKTSQLPIYEIEFRLNHGGAKGTMHVTPSGFVVHPTANVVEKQKKSSSWGAQREKFLQSGLLTPSGTPGMLTLTEDVILPSASAAAALLYGGNLNGRDYWKTESGASLKQIESAAVAQAEDTLDSDEE